MLGLEPFFEYTNSLMMSKRYHDIWKKLTLTSAANSVFFLSNTIYLLYKKI